MSLILHKNVERRTKLYIGRKIDLRRLFGFADVVAPDDPAPTPISEFLGLPAAAAAAAAAAAGLALTRLKAAAVVAAAAATFCSHGSE